MTEFLKSLLSRKFLLALAGLLTLVANKQYPEAVTVLLGYLGVEGAADVATRVTGNSPTGDSAK